METNSAVLGGIPFQEVSQPTSHDQDDPPTTSNDGLPGTSAVANWGYVNWGDPSVLGGLAERLESWSLLQHTFPKCHVSLRTSQLKIFPHFQNLTEQKSELDA